MTDARLTSSLQRFSLFVLKWRKVYENLDYILHDWARDKYKKSTVEALNKYKKHSLAGKRKIKPFLA